MKIRISDVSEFREAFEAVARVAPKRSPKPILQNVMLAASVAGEFAPVLLSATDLEIGTTLPALGLEVLSRGRVLLPTERFGAILKGIFPAHPVEIESDESSVKVAGKGARFTLPTEDPAIFPSDSWPAAFAPEATISAGDLKRAIKRTVYATDEESTRYAMGGLLFEAEGDALVLVGTDGRRLARATTHCAVARESLSKAQPIVPVRALRSLSSILGDDEAPVEIAFAGNLALFRSEGIRFVARLVEGRFPRYQDVFPGTTNQVVATIHAGPLRAAIGQAAITTSEDSRGVDCEFKPGLLTLCGKASDVGESSVELAIDYEGPELGVTFDPRYVVQALAALDDDTAVAVHLIDHKNPVVMRVEGFDYVVMPLTRDR